MKEMFYWKKYITIIGLQWELKDNETYFQVL